jgi:hypothetical protein
VVGKYSANQWLTSQFESNPGSPKTFCSRATISHLKHKISFDMREHSGPTTRLICLGEASPNGQNEYEDNRERQRGSPDDHRSTATVTLTVAHIVALVL